MSKPQSTGEVLSLALMDHTDNLTEAVSLAQQTLEKQIEGLTALEARVDAAIASFQAAIQRLEGERAKLEAERVKLKAIGPELQQGAAWAMRETLREQGGQIRAEMKGEVRDAFAQPLQDIQAGARHVLQNVWETKLLYIGFVLLFGILIGYGADQYRVGVHQSRMETQLMGIQGNINYIWEHLQQQEEEQKKAGTHSGKGK